MVPVAQKKKLYDMKDFPKLTDFGQDENCLIIGAGAAPWTYLQRNAEVSKIFLNNFNLLKIHVFLADDAKSKSECRWHRGAENVHIKNA